MPPRTPPNFNLSDDEKLALVQQLVPTLLGTINAMSPPGAPLADDFIDLLAQAIGMMLAADTHIDTPKKVRLGVETAANHVGRHLKAFRAAQDEMGGESFLMRLLDRYQAEQVADPRRLDS
jgi:hypothetical protein